MKGKIFFCLLATFFGCCASVMTATASNTTTTRIDGTAALFIARLVWALFITPIEVKKSVIYTAEGDRDSSNKKVMASIRLNATVKSHRIES